MANYRNLSSKILSRASFSDIYLSVDILHHLEVRRKSGSPEMDALDSLSLAQQQHHTPKGSNNTGFGGSKLGIFRTTHIVPASPASMERRT